MPRETPQAAGRARAWQAHRAAAAACRSCLAQAGRRRPKNYEETRNPRARTPTSL
jgi:hypothetical protein